MSKIKNWLKTQAIWTEQEEGQGLAEYALILALVAVACAAALTSLQARIVVALHPQVPCMSACSRRWLWKVCGSLANFGVVMAEVPKLSKYVPYWRRGR